MFQGGEMDLSMVKTTDPQDGTHEYHFAHILFPGVHFLVPKAPFSQSKEPNMVFLHHIGPGGTSEQLRMYHFCIFRRNPFKNECLHHRTTHSLQLPNVLWLAQAPTAAILWLAASPPHGTHFEMTPTHCSQISQSAHRLNQVEEPFKPVMVLDNRNWKQSTTCWVTNLRTTGLNFSEWDLFPNKYVMMEVWVNIVSVQ